MRLVVAVLIVAGLFAVSPLAGGIALGLVGAVWALAVLSRPSQQALEHQARAEVASGQAAQQLAAQRADDTVSCELCGEEIKIRAKVCRFCQAWECGECASWIRAGQACGCVECDCGRENLRPGEKCTFFPDEDDD